MRRTIGIVLLLLSTAVFYFALGQNTAAAKTFHIVERKAKVVYVIDGDTVILDSQERIRLLGVDCPEVGTSWSTQATKMTKDYTLNKTITYSYDQYEKYDPYHRIIAVIEVGRTNLAYKLLEAGLAKLMPISDYAKSIYSYYKDRSDEAKKAKLGIWSTARLHSQFFNSAALPQLAFYE